MAKTHANLGEGFPRPKVDAPRRMSYDAYMALPEEKRRCELLNGWMVREPSPGDDHQAVVVNLCWLFRDYTRRTGAGRVYVAPFDTVLSFENVVQPDVLFVAAERLGIVTARNVQGAPDLAVEVISLYSGRKDRLLRLRLYARFGIREYWIVDPGGRTVEVFALNDPDAPEGDRRYEPAGCFQPGSPIRSRVLPEFAPDPSLIFE